MMSFNRTLLVGLLAGFLIGAIITAPTLLYAVQTNTPQGFVNTITLVDEDGDAIDVTNDGKIQCQ